jgi:hypothetical protein
MGAARFADDPPAQFRQSHAAAITKLQVDVDWIKKIAAVGLSTMTAVGLAILTVLATRGG